jgi:hypothetical protein
MRITQKKGDLAVAKAIYSFTNLGYEVSRPLTESAPYDLIVDTGDCLYRVQVKYCGAQNRVVSLRRVHSNSQGYVVKKTTPGAYDWLYVLNADGKEYLIRRCLHGRNGVTPQESDLL